jgi:NADP-dependent aldehyde dehydrogenase
MNIFVNGEMLLGYRAMTGSAVPEYAHNPVTGMRMEPAFRGASRDDVQLACTLAESAFDVYRNIPLQQRASFLETIADEILALGDTLVQRAVSESGLPQMRIEGERGRTIGQLQLFASVVRSGDWLGARIDQALPNRTPLPRPDLRMRHLPLGPVAVFGASNFPLAFSVAGGDTASALAAGCPVIAKAHPAHPGTCELVGKAINTAAKKCSMPEGVFSLIFGGSHELGADLVSNSAIKAVGFTGSRAGGLALMNIAANRPEPIPVYAEMSSINPVFLLPNELGQNASNLAAGFVGSLTMGAGQFCTNPGLVVGLAGDDLSNFIDNAKAALAETSAQAMLTEGIHGAYCKGVDELSANDVVNEVASGLASTEPNRCQSRLFSTTAAQFLTDTSLSNEVFGASALIVQCDSTDDLLAVAEHLEGQLTATMQLNDDDLELARRLLPILERKAGRVLCNGYPTGVEVGHAMVHGGPFPATSDGRSTSVGSAAILRFLRPVCYQDLPASLLPIELQNENSLGLTRLLDGSCQT